MSFSDCLSGNRTAWSNVRFNSQEIDADLTVNGDVVALGGLVIDGPIVADTITVSSLLSLDPGSQVDGNPEFTGEISAVGGFKPTGIASQNSLNNVNKTELDILYVSTIFATGSSANKLWCGRCGDLITLSFRPEYIGVQAGQVSETIVADMSLDPGFDEYRPHYETHIPVLYKTPGVNEPADYNIGSIKVTPTGTFEFNYELGTDGKFPVPSSGQSTGWQHDITISYLGV